MKLILELLGPPRLMGARQRCELRTGSVSVGRSPEAGWVIPDSDRTISRLHLRVDSAHGEFMLTDTSANGVYVNGSAAPVSYGASVKLRDGDRLQVGEAQIAVAIEAKGEPSAAVVPFELDADEFLSELVPSVPARDPLGGPFGTVAVPQATRPVFGPSPSQRGGVDANWMIDPVGPSSAQAHLSAPAAGQMKPPVSLTGLAMAGRVQPGGQRNLRDLANQHPDLSALELASAVDAAAQSLDPLARSTLFAEIAVLFERGR